MLKALFAGLTLSMLIVMGCSKESDPAKSPGDKDAPAESATFKLEMPSTAPNIAKGTDEAIKIGVDRGKDMKEAPVELTFEPPKGLTVEPKTATIPADADDVEVTLTAAEDAGAGEKDIKVTGKSDGKVTNATFKVEVKDAE